MQRKRVVGYVRVSGQEQARSGYGLPVQRQAVEDFCRAQGWELVDVYEDPGVSGTTPLHDREGLRTVLHRVHDSQHAAATPISGVVVARWDRLARDTLQALLIEQEFERVGAVVFSADGTNGDQLVRELQHVLASYNRREVVARLRAGRAAKAARGGYAGGRPRFGYMAVGKELRVNEDEAEVVAWIFDHVANKRWTVRQVAARLHQKRAGGRTWDANRVLRVLHFDGYKRGDDPIVDPRIWNKTQRVLAGRNTRGDERELAAA